MLEKATSGAVRVKVQLINATTDAHLWAETCDRDLKEILALESENAETVADALKAQLLPAESARIAKVPARRASEITLAPPQLQSFSIRPE